MLVLLEFISINILESFPVCLIWLSRCFVSCNSLLTSCLFLKAVLPHVIAGRMNRRMIILGEWKKKKKGGGIEWKEAAWHCIQCLSGFTCSEIVCLSTCMLNTDCLAVHILNAFCHASHGEILVWLTLELLT